MAKPIINRIRPFDALNETTISFTVSGILVRYNEIIIRNADTMAVVFDEIVENMRLEHVIPANTLVNGTKYKAEIKCYSKNKETETPWSDSYQFICLKTPTFYMQGLSTTTPTKVETTSLNVSVVYQQVNNEKIKEFKYCLYDDTGNFLIETSPTFYTYNPENDYLFKMLNNGISYNVKCVGVTENGIELDTGLNPIYVSFINPATYSIIVAESNNREGFVDYYTNLVIVDADRQDYKYVDKTYIDLTNDTLVYSQGFLLLNTYSFMVKLKNANYGKIIEMTTGTKTVVIECVETENNDKCRYKLTAKDNDEAEYIIYSEEIDMDDKNLIMWIKCLDGLYDMIFV